MLNPALNPSPRSQPKAATPAIFIDGEAGTTGLQIRDMLAAETGLTLLSLPHEARKDAAAKRAIMTKADIAILCLPDEAARAAVAMADELGEAGPRIIDASTAHRVAPGWVYGFPELAPGHADRIAGARRVANPGCYPTGAIALLRPFIDAGFMTPDHPVSVNAVSGYSGGGKAMIEAYEGEGGEGQEAAPAFELYGLSLAHKHVPELMAGTGLTRRPIFVPSVGRFRQGMLVSVPLHLAALSGVKSSAALRAALAAHYAGSRFVRVADATETAALKGKLEPEVLNGSNLMELFVFSDAADEQVVLVARLDNLGKGASGAAVQNLKLMLGMG